MDYRENENRLLIDDIKEKCLWGIRVRYLIVGLALPLIVFSLVNKNPPGIYLGLVLFVGGYNALAHVLHSIKMKLDLWQVVVFRSVFQVFDVAATTLLIYITGWLESPYWFLYLVLIILSGFGMFSYYSLSVFLIASVSALFYLGLLWSAYTGFLPVYGPSFTLSPEELLRSIFNKAIFTTVSFFLFAGTIYYFSKLLSQHREELYKKNEQLLGALEELKDIDLLKDEFISTASHELRTPLSIVRENVSLIEDGVVGEVDAKQKKLLSVSRENIDRLAGILDNLLDISKIESRSLELNCQPTDISSIAKRAIELMADKANYKKISIEERLPEPLIARADADQILRVFINLIDNAVKYTQREGKIGVEVEDAGARIKASVRDNGPGIAEANLPRVFGRFVRFDIETKGSGLGLSICKGIIEMHHGKIWVESKSGQGSKFTFAIPKGEAND